MNIAETKKVVHQLLQEHNLFDQGWRFKLSRGKHRIGSCHYQDQTIRISHSHIVMGTNAEVMDTIKHEVAHALVGPGKGHGPEWKTTAWRIGASPRASTHLSYNVPYKYAIKCGVCGRVLQKRHRRMNPNRLRTRHCINCGDATSRGHLYLTLA